MNFLKLCFNRRFTIRAKLSCRGFHSNLNNFIKSNNERMNKAIMDQSIKCELREVRQNKLYSEYVNNVTFSPDFTTININELSQKYNLTPQYVLSSLYFHGWLKQKNRYSNIFNLPEKQKIISITHEEFKKDNSIDQVFNQYVEYTSNRNLKDDISTYLLKEYSYVILRKDNNYDVAQFGYELVDNTFNLVEFKDPNRSDFDAISLPEIIKISKEFNYVINQLGCVTINNIFDGSHIYRIDEFDKIYGYGAFNSALINYISTYVDYTGEDSIRNQETIDLIKYISELVCEGNSELKNKLYIDFVSNSNHYGNDKYIEIGKLMDMYKIQPHELLYAMYKFNQPIRMGFVSFLENIEATTSFNLEDAKEILKTKNYVSYIYGKPIKNVFRKCRGENQKISIRGCEDGPIKGIFYICILSIMRIKIIHL